MKDSDVARVENDLAIALNAACELSGTYPHNEDAVECYHRLKNLEMDLKEAGVKFVGVLDR